MFRVALHLHLLVLLFVLFFAVSMREASAASCLHRLRNAMPVRKQSASRIKSTNSHCILVSNSVTLQLVVLHSPHNRWSLTPKRTGTRAAGPRSSHVHRRYPIGGTLGICLGKLKDESGSTKQLPGQLASSQARRHAGGIHWPMAHASASTPSLA